MASACEEMDALHRLLNGIALLDVLQSFATMVRYVFCTSGLCRLLFSCYAIQIFRRWRYVSCIDAAQFIIVDKAVIEARKQSRSHFHLQAPREKELHGSSPESACKIDVFALCCTTCHDFHKVQTNSSPPHAQINAAPGQYVRPQMSERGPMAIVEGRHPLVEQLQGSDAFVPNDTYLAGGSPPWSHAVLALLLRRTATIPEGLQNLPLSQGLSYGACAQ